LRWTLALLIVLAAGLVSPAHALYANRDFLWPSPGGVPVMIRVCWENPTAAPAARLQWVQSAVESTWQRHARVNLVEWDTCAAGDPGIHIQITSDVSMAPGGFTLDGVTNGVKLDLFFTGGPAGCTTGETAREHCVRSVAVHEFGHVLGFYHEEERPDYVEPPMTAPGAPCAKQSASNSSPQYFGAYDINSVMSYCGQPFDTPATWKEQLSPGEVVALQHAYGRRLPGTIVSPAGNCAASHPVQPNGVVLWECDELGGNQEWRYSTSTGQLSLSGAGTGRCLEGASQVGLSAFLGVCASDRTGQRWRFAQVEVRGWGALCLDLQGGVKANGTPIQMWSCGALGGANQRWKLSETGAIRFGDTDRCLTAPLGRAAYLWNCNQPALQRFALLPGGQLELARQRGVCLDVQAPTNAQYLSGVGLPVNGLPVQAFPCLANQLNQRWNLSGPARHRLSGGCLARPSGSELNGTSLRVGPCRDAVSTRWDYYWLPG
jgi:hypothetical protein